ncbi:MAG: endonuclease/exonuclease/phosphatase family protein [Acutalibacteraceae bacterium]
MCIIKNLVALFTAILLTLGITVGNGSGEVTDVPEQKDGAVRIVSFNLRSANDIYGTVKNRSVLMEKVLTAYAPDSFGVQEANPEWLELLDESLGDRYARVGEGRNLDKNTEYSCVFYLKDKYELVDSGTIWLSETPDVPGSKDYMTTYPRICTWATLKNRETGFTYTHINTHLDHLLECTRTRQADVLLNKIDELSNDYPVVCTGDFNTNEGTDTYNKMTAVMDDSRLVAEKTESGKTYHNYGRGDALHTSAIDFIFVQKGTNVAEYKIIKNMVNGMYVSDHYGLCADIYFE